MSERLEVNKEILMILESYLEKYPDMRFGQALLNLGVMDLDSDEFYTESEVTLQNMLVQIAKSGTEGLTSGKKRVKMGLKKARNGYILQYKDDEGELSQEVYAEDDIQGLLFGVMEVAGYCGGRHSAERVYIVKAPGDKHEDFTEEHANVIWGKE